MIKVKTDEMISFTCDNCGQKFTDTTVKISVLLYGVVFLTGNEAHYACITCPSCIKTLLIEPDNSRIFNMQIDGLDYPDGTYAQALLRYNSSIFYDPLDIAELKEISNYFYGAYEINYPLFETSVKELIRNVTGCQPPFLCTVHPEYLEEPYGPFSSIWYFFKKDLDKYLEVENQKGIRAFPRYVFKNSIYKNMNEFCWRYLINEKFSNKESGEPVDPDDPILKEFLEEKPAPSISVYELKEYFDLFKNSPNFDLDKFIREKLKASPPAESKFTDSRIYNIHEKEQSFLAEAFFLELLLDDPGPFFNSIMEQELSSRIGFADPFKGLWKTINPYKGKNAPTEISQFNPDIFQPPDFSDKISMIKENKQRSTVSKFLSDNFMPFIHDYIGISKNSDFCYGYVWKLKSHYIEKLHAVIEKEMCEEARYAIFLEGNLWTIIFNGRKIRGLKGKGFDHIRELVKRPGKFYISKELASDGGSNIFHDNVEDNLTVQHSIPTQASADNKALNEIMKEIIEIDKDIEIAKRDGHYEYIKTLYEDKNALIAYTRQNYSKGKPRTFATEDKKHKDAIGNSIKRAIASLEIKDRAAGAHFKKAILGPSSRNPGYYPEEYYEWIIG